MMKALEDIASHHLANSISISDGTGETTYTNGREEILAQNPGELAAAAAGIPVLNATGDCGVVQNLAVANGQCEDVSNGPDTATWDDSPWNTGVGGSVPNVSPTNGKRLGPDPLWHVRIHPATPSSPKVPGSPRCSPAPPTRTAWRTSPGARCGRYPTSSWTPRTAPRRRLRCSTG